MQQGVDSLASPNPCNSTGFLLWVGGHTLRSFYRQFRFDAEAAKPWLASLAQGQAAGLHLPPASTAPHHPAGRASASALPLPSTRLGGRCTFPEVGEPSWPWPGCPHREDKLPPTWIHLQGPRGWAWGVPGGSSASPRVWVCTARGPGLHRGKAVGFVQRRGLQGSLVFT